MRPEPAGTTPWERSNPSFPEDLFRSWMDVMTRPFAFYGDIDPRRAFSRPLLFFLIFFVLGSGLGSMSSNALLGDWYASRGIDAPDLTWNLFVFFLSPFAGLFGLLVNVLFVHVGVRLFVPGGGTIGVTARGLCYSAAPQVLAVIPLLGWLIAPFWSLFLAVVAVHRMHRTSVGRAAAAVLVPAFVFWFAMGILFFFLIMMFAIAAGGAG